MACYFFNDKLGQKIHEDIVQYNLPLPLAALINMYGRGGDLECKSFI